MEREGFVIVRTPACWFSGKQQAGELLEADVPPGEAHLQAPRVGGSKMKSLRQRKESPREAGVAGERQRRVISSSAA